MNWNRLFPRLSIRAKLAIAFAALAILPASGITVLGVRHAVRQAREFALTTMAHDVVEARAQTQQRLREAEADLAYLTTQVLGPRVLQGAEADWSGAEGAVTELLRVKPVLFQVKAVSADGELLFAADAQGARSVDGRFDEGVYYAVRGRGLEGGRHVVTPVELRGSPGRPGSVPAMAIVEAVVDAAGAYRGAVVAEAHAAELFSELENASPNLYGVTGLVGSDGLILYHSERKADWARLLATRNELDLRREVTEAAAAQILGADAAGSLQIPDGRVVSYAPMRLLEAGAPPLVMYRILPRAVLGRVVRGFLQVTAAAGIVAVFAVLALAILAAHQFTQPIYRLSGAARELAVGGTLDAPLDIRTGDELESLSEDFTTMAVALDRQRRGLEDLVSERTQALAETLAELEGLLHHSADAIAGLDAARRVRVWNEGAESLFGHRASEAIGRDIDDLLLPLGERWDREATFIWHELDETGVLPNFQTERVDKAGKQFPVGITQTAISDDQGRRFGYSLIIRDTTLQTRLEEQMRRSERLAALSVMAAGLAHELGNPLAVIENRIECMQREIEGTEHADGLEEDLEVLSQHAGRLHGLICDFLAFARDEEWETGSVDLNELVRCVVGLIEPTYRRRSVHLATDLDDELPSVPGTAKAIETVCMNLLLNALDATGAGGRVTVETAYDTARETVAVRVSDSGEGIPEDLQPRVFEPFVTTKDPGKGTGLGLAVCRAVMDRHGGSIGLESEPGAGSTFTMTFPLTRFEAK